MNSYGLPCWLPICLVAMFGCNANKAAPISTEARPESSENLDLQWPDVPGFEREEVHRFDDPRLGYAIEYSSPCGLAATVYVYNGGRASIPTGRSSILTAEFLKAKEDIKTAQRRGTWKSVEPGTDQETRLGSGPNAPEALWVSFRLGHDAGDAKSDSYMTGYRDQFVKIRCTYLAKDQVECEAGQKRFIEAIGALLAR